MSLRLTKVLGFYNNFNPNYTVLTTNQHLQGFCAPLTSNYLRAAQCECMRLGYLHQSWTDLYSRFGFENNLSDWTWQNKQKRINKWEYLKQKYDKAVML